MTHLPDFLQDIPGDRIMAGWDDIMMAPLQQAFITGRHPAFGVRTFSGVTDSYGMVPGTVVRSALWHGERDGSAMFKDIRMGDGWLIHSSFSKAARSLSVNIVADRQDIVDDLITAIRDKAPARPEPDDPGDVDFTFWYRMGHSVDTTIRRLMVRPWADIRDNYVQDARPALDALMGIRDSDVRSGRLVLFHGPAGTGKTTLIRALATEWRSWCDVHYVVDPETFLNDPGYLMNLIMGERYATDKARWRLVVLEDTGELIAADAKASTGQALSRLLNISDGILGQGQRVMFVITTNDRLSELNPAVTRAGRCLAKVEISPIPRRAAEQWLGAGHPGLAELHGRDEIPLGDLIAIRDGGDVLKLRDHAAAGAGRYL